MLFVYILLALLLVVLLLWHIPITGRVTYDGELRAQVNILGVPYYTFPEKKQSAFAEKRATKNRPQSKKEKTLRKARAQWREVVALFREDGLEATLHYLLETVKLLGQTLGKLLRVVTIKELKLELVIATEDPADTAVRYGQVCSVVYPALAALQKGMRVRRQQVRIEPNFLLEKSDAFVDLRVGTYLGPLLGAILAALVHFMMINDEGQPTDIKGGQA